MRFLAKTTSYKTLCGFTERVKKILGAELYSSTYFVMQKTKKSLRVGHFLLLLIMTSKIQTMTQEGCGQVVI